MKNVLITTMVLGLVITMLSLYGSAYAAFDTDGNYYCNASNLPLEKTIYQASVEKLNSDMHDYLSLNPSATDQQLQTYLVSVRSGNTDPTYAIMNEAKACLDSNGIDPSEVATPSHGLLQVLPAPEFGGIAGVIISVAVFFHIIIQRRYGVVLYK